MTEAMGDVQQLTCELFGKEAKMSENTSRLTILINPKTKQQLEIFADKSDQTVSQIIRKLIKTHLAKPENSLTPPSEHPGVSRILLY
jgi:alkyl hydroperoxide reductase subunit AhpC